MLKNNGFHNRHSPFARQTAFSPLSLFSGGAPGAWYDPSDYTTLFQDSAGSVPVTAVEQPVGLMLDKSQGLVLGSQLISNPGPFVNTTGWTLSGGAGASLTVVSGALRATNGAVGYAGGSIPFTTVVGVTYKIEFSIPSSGRGRFGTTPSSGDLFAAATGNQTAYIRATGTTTYFSFYVNSGTAGDTTDLANISVKELAGNHAFQATSASRPVLSARVNKLLATAALATQSVTTRATAHTLRFEGAGSVTLTGTAIGVYTAGTHSITTTAGTLTLTVLGSVTSADLRETNDGVGVPAYQAVVTSTNYATTGFLPYVRFDGIDDSLSTNSISFTSTDKMSVFAGVRKLSDAAIGILVELSAIANFNPGAFAMGVPGWNPVANQYGFMVSGGTGSQWANSPANYPAPNSAVLTNQLNLSTSTRTSQMIERINGAPIALSFDTGGTTAGNFGNYPLYIGRRNNASLPFNGQLYGLIIVGKAVTAGELSSTETYVATKTGVTL